jgi:acetolactate synthase-1/2/3 large subunit
VKASDLFVRCLEEEGVRHIFAVPGEENLDVVESIRESSIELVVTRHEQHAAFMAATYGRLTGRAGVVLATLGPGATNLLTGIAYAQLCGMPLVAITGQKAIDDNWQGNFQIVDVVGTFRPVTKWNRTIVSPETIPRFVRHAFKVAEDERPGACHLELPEDVASDEADEERPHPRVRLRRPVADDKAIDAAVELIRSSNRPLVLVSSGANRKRVGKQLLQFLERLGLFAVTTQMGKGVISDAHPQSLFCLGIHKKDYVHAAIQAADLLITVGYSIVEYPPSIWNEHRDKKILHLDFSLAEPDRFYNPDVEIIGDISHALWAIRSRMTDEDCFEGTIMSRLREEISNRLHHDFPERTHPPKPQTIVGDVRAVMGDRDIICLDNGIYKLWFARMYPTYADNTVLLDNALATMGAGLASAMAAKMVHPDRRVLAICGDGGFMMNSQDLETAVRMKQDLVVLILRDEGYGFIRWKQEQMGFPEFGMQFGNPDFARYAEAYGARGVRVGPEDRLDDVLESAFGAGGPVLVECPIDYAENAKLSADLFGEVEHLLG